MKKFEFYQLLNKKIKEEPHLRRGRAAYILMTSLFPEMFDSKNIVPEEMDPFNDDNKTESFVSHYLD